MVRQEGWGVHDSQAGGLVGKVIDVCGCKRRVVEDPCMMCGLEPLLLCGTVLSSGAAFKKKMPGGLDRERVPCGRAVAPF